MNCDKSYAELANIGGRIWPEMKPQPYGFTACAERPGVVNCQDQDSLACTRGLMALAKSRERSLSLGFHTKLQRDLYQIAGAHKLYLKAWACYEHGTYSTRVRKKAFAGAPK